MKKTMKRNKAEARATILYDPTPANAGPAWAWHAAPEGEKQAQAWSLFFFADGSLFVPIKIR